MAKKYEDKLIFAGFVKINGGMLVNVRNIKSISTKSAELIGNISLPVSKKYYTEASERFMEYVRRQSFQ